MDLSKIEAALERIAAALEQIAGGKDQSTETGKKLESGDKKFPWNSVSLGTWEWTKKVVNSTKHPVLDAEGNKYQWPLSCNDLMTIGRKRFAKYPYMRKAAINEISWFMEHYGYNWK